MIDLWITFFMLGTTLSRVRVNQDWTTFFQGTLSITAAALILTQLMANLKPRLRKLTQLALVATAALLWSSLHSAPMVGLSDYGPFESAGVIRVGRLSDGAVLLRTPAGLVESYGSREQPSHGDIKFGGTSSLFTRYRSYYQDIEPSREIVATKTMATDLKNRFKRQLRSFPSWYRDWLQAALFGEMASLPHSIHHAVRLTGLHHLLVISGIHLSVVSFLSYWTLAIVPLALYSLGLIAPGHWKSLASVMKLGIICSSIFYFKIVGLPPNAERALIACILTQMCRVFMGCPPPIQRLKILVGCQSLFFPLGCLSEGNVLGWGAYLIVTDVASQVGWRELHQFRGLICTQTRMFVLAAAVFGECNLLPILFMPTLMPVFALMLGATAVSLVVPETWPLTEMALKCHLALQWLMFRLDEAVEHLPWLSHSGQDLPWWFRPSMVIFSIVILLNSIKRLSVTRYCR